MFKHILVLFAALTFAVSATAAEDTAKETQTEKVKIDELKGKKTSNDIDNEITNARMRATTGSKSKLSIRTALSYQGGSLKQPAAKLRPNLVGDFDTRTGTYFYGNIAGKYKLSKNDSLAFGGGISIDTPFHNKDSEVKGKSDAFDPYAEYSRVFKAGRFQNVLSTSVTYQTGESARNSGYDYLFDVSYNTLTTIDKLTVGTSFALKKNTFYKGSDSLDAAQTDYGANIYPYAEYSINDKYSLRTVFGWFNWRHQKSFADAMTFERGGKYQSIGLGMALSRDFYLYPSVQFLAENIRDDATNVGLTAYINMF